jgi:anthranilate 1,2-dioxygenase small subunit
MLSGMGHKSQEESGLNIREIKYEVQELIEAYAGCLDDGRYEEWPEFFTDTGVYKLIARENYDRNLPLGTIFCDSKKMMEDRVVAIREACVYSPSYLLHLVGGITVTGQRDDTYLISSKYVVFRTIRNDETKVFNAGKYFDEIVFVEGQPKFKQRTVVYDSDLIPGMLVIPI